MNGNENKNPEEILEYYKVFMDCIGKTDLHPKFTLPAKNDELCDFQKLEYKGTMPIYIAVFSSQERHFDEFGHGYLPLFHTVFRLSYDKDKVLGDVYSTFYSYDNYEIIEEIQSVHEDGDNGMTLTFRYNDRNSDAYAIYTLEVMKEFID